VLCILLQGLKKSTEMTIEVPNHQKVHVTYDDFVLVLHPNIGNVHYDRKTGLKKNTNSTQHPREEQKDMHKF
jgi:hypothetical protein